MIRQFIKTDSIIKKKKNILLLFFISILFSFLLVYFIDSHFYKESNYLYSNFFSTISFMRCFILGMLAVYFFTKDINNGIIPSYISYGYKRSFIFLCKSAELFITYLAYILLESFIYILLLSYFGTKISIWNIISTNLFSLLWSIVLILELVLISLIAKASEITVSFSILINFIISIIPSSISEYLPNSYYNLRMYLDIFSLNKFLFIIFIIFVFILFLFIINIYYFKRIEL